MRLSVTVLFTAAALTLNLPLRAQGWPAAGQKTSQETCSANNFHSDGLVSYAESRQQRVASASENYINPGVNGSIKVHGWQNGEVLVTACLQTAAESQGDAEALAKQVTIVKGPGAIEPEGPATDSQHYWGVSYEVWLPNSSNVKMDAHNGSIAVDGLRGQIHFHTLNGSIKLSGVGGATTNGSITVDLVGSGWNGNGLKVETTNGSVRLNLPQNFSARVEASTVNGSLRTDFPITVSGEIRHDLSFVLGSGGPDVAVHTVNGSVHIGRI
jgi:hypothetical protein